MNDKEHEYMHAHGIEHTHHSETDPHHSHPHEHPHSACESHGNCDHNCSGCGAVDPKAEAVALMQYMVKHNMSHTVELEKLGKRLCEIGETMAGNQVMQAVAEYEKGNMRLSTVLAALNIPNT